MRVVLRAKGLVAALWLGYGFLAIVGVGASASHGPASGRAVGGVIGLAAAAGFVRMLRVGLRLDPTEVVIRSLTTTVRLTRAEVLGLAMQPVMRGRCRRLAVVCVDGRVVPAEWTVSGANNLEWTSHGAWAAAGFGPTQEQVAPTLAAARRLVAVDALPVATAEPGLTPETVSPVVPPQPWLGWETIFVVTAFALPGVADAVEVLARHIDGVSDLNEFALPLPHNPLASLFILILGYLTTALVVPIALLLLARTGQSLKVLGIERHRLGSDAAGAVALLAGVWAVNIIVLLPLSHVLNNKHLTNTATNSHVPAYFIVYGLIVSATTAINEEVVVNGYFMTRLSQRGWSPNSALALSLAVRTSYHAYYGIGLIATVPFGYLVTRSFQKRGRLARPIITHFLYDAILFTISVLTS
jgi:membrane protease YdiL (CAAX protease family)